MVTKLCYKLRRNPKKFIRCKKKKKKLKKQTKIYFFFLKQKVKQDKRINRLIAEKGGVNDRDEE